MISLAWFRRWSAERLSARRPSAKRERRRLAWHVEELEARVLLTAYSPAEISQAYGVNKIMFGSVKGDGTGQTIAIVDAYHAPNIQNDLAVFNAIFGLSNTDGKGAPVLTVATPQGTPVYNKVWAQESTLDVEWAHAIAPGAHILLVEAKSNSLADLLAAVDYARKQPGVSVVSMSWGSTEFSTETAYDTYFTTTAGHTGVSFIAASGDTGAVSTWPAVSPNVVAVGGTTLATTNTAGTYGSETAWSGSGGGVSVYEVKPSYQSSVSQSNTKRTGPDVAYDANPSTGVKVYFTDATTGSSAWYVFGGTSIGAPQWAAIVAIANQGRVLAGKGTLDGKTQLLPGLYSLATTDFHDITSGSTTYRTTTLRAGAGYDLVTGRGSPIANLVVADLIKLANSAIVAGGTTSGGSQNGGRAGTRFEGPHFGAAGVSITTFFVFGNESDISGLIPFERPGIVDNPTAPAEFASRFGTMAHSDHTQSWARPGWQTFDPTEFSSSLVAVSGVNSGLEHAESPSTAGTSAWEPSTDRWSTADRTTKGTKSAPAVTLSFDEWIPSDLADAYFVSLGRGDAWLPELEAA